MNCIWQDLSDAGYKVYVNPLSVSIKHKLVVMSSRLVLNNTPLWSKQRKVHYSQTDISFIWIIWHPLSVHNQTQSNYENRLVLEPPRQEREDKRQAPSSIRPGGGPMADPLHTLHNHPSWPSLSLPVSFYVEKAHSEEWGKRWNKENI